MAFVDRAKSSPRNSRKSHVQLLRQVSSILQNFGELSACLAEPALLCLTKGCTILGVLLTSFPRSISPPRVVPYTGSVALGEVLINFENSFLNPE